MATRGPRAGFLCPGPALQRQLGVRASRSQTVSASGCDQLCLVMNTVKLEVTARLLSKGQDVTLKRDMVSEQEPTRI